MARIRSPHHTVPLHLLALAIAALPEARRENLAGLGAITSLATDCAG